MESLRLSPPTLLEAHHLTEDFTCGIPSLDDWLRKRALQNQVNGASRTYVTRTEASVVGYYSLASGALTLSDAPSPVRRNMPDPIPLAILGRLAVDTAWQRKGVGTALLQDAVLRTLKAAGILGIRGLLAHALSEEAKAFYQQNGFRNSPTQPMTLVLSLKGLT